MGVDTPPYFEVSSPSVKREAIASLGRSESPWRFDYPPPPPKPSLMLHLSGTIAFHPFSPRIHKFSTSSFTSYDYTRLCWIRGRIEPEPELQKRHLSTRLTRRSMGRVNVSFLPNPRYPRLSSAKLFHAISLVGIRDRIMCLIMHLQRGEAQAERLHVGHAAVSADGVHGAPRGRCVTRELRQLSLELADQHLLEDVIQQLRYGARNTERVG